MNLSIGIRLFQIKDLSLYCNQITNIMTKLSKHSERNLSVIENFILHITHDSEGDVESDIANIFTANQMYQMAREYIAEDHVDGEDSEEALKEHSEARLKEYDNHPMILDEVFLSDDIDEENPVRVYTEIVGDENIFITVPYKHYKDVRRFAMTKKFSTIAAENRDEILSYTLGVYDKKQGVLLSDVFLQGKYINEILTEEK